MKLQRPGPHGQERPVLVTGDAVDRLPELDVTGSRVGAPVTCLSDVITTGTPAGVALGRPDSPYLLEGDVVELEITGLGRQRPTCGPA